VVSLLVPVEGVTYEFDDLSKDEAYQKKKSTEKKILRQARERAARAAASASASAGLGKSRRK
jgi:hypothetical protein